MEGISMGVWVAHGEGRFQECNKGDLENVKENISVCYIDENNRPTDKYPYNPNGSPFGATAISSPDGRHLAMMPHPERSFLKWQLPYSPEKIPNLDISSKCCWNKFNKNKELIIVSPWFMMFCNAVQWCSNIKKNKPI